MCIIYENIYVKYANILINKTIGLVNWKLLEYYSLQVSE